MPFFDWLVAVVVLVSIVELNEKKEMIIIYFSLF